jgi:hypothetical protein
MKVSVTTHTTLAVNELQLTHLCSLVRGCALVDRVRTMIVHLFNTLPVHTSTVLVQFVARSIIWSIELVTHITGRLCARAYTRTHEVYDLASIVVPTHKQSSGVVNAQFLWLDPN